MLYSFLNAVTYACVVFLLLSASVLGMDNKEFEDRLKQAILHRNVAELKLLSESELFSTKKTEGGCNFPFLEYAIQPPPYDKNMKSLVKKFCESKTKKKDAEILKSALNPEKVIETICFLIEKGVDPNAASCQKKGLCLAHKGGGRHTPLTDFLFYNGQSWQPSAYTCEVPWHFKHAVPWFYDVLYQKIAKTIVVTLLERGADPNLEKDVLPFTHETGCHYAMKGIRNPEIIRLLVAHGADLGRQDYFGNSCINTLVKEGRLDICKKVFPCLPTRQDKHCMLTLLLIRKFFENKFPKPVLFEIMQWTFGEIFLLVKKYQTRTINELLEMKNKHNKNPYILAQEYYKLLQECGCGDQDKYSMGPWRISHKEAVEGYEQIIDFVNPSKYK